MLIICEVLQLKNNVVDFLSALSGPLYIDSPDGKRVKEIMLSSEGEQLRHALPQYKPWCAMFPNGICILSDGSITTCCLDALGENSFANIYQQDILTIWNKIIPKVLKRGLYKFPYCTSCIGKQGLPSLISESGDYNKWINRDSCYPNELIVEVMSSCNYQCCVAKDLHNHRYNSKLDLQETFLKIKPLLPYIKRLKLFNYGEPLLNNDLGQFVLNCRNSSQDLILTLATNGLLLDETISRLLIKSHLNQVVVSVHGGPGTSNMLKYAKTGANYEQVLSNIETLLDLRQKYQSQLPKVSLRAILFAWNDTNETMEQFRQDAKNLGLSATWGNLDTDNYHWILDEGKGGLARSSKVFVPGSEALQRLIYKKEFFVREFW